MTIKYTRAIIGIDGNCGYALLGPNLQEGESEFVEIPAPLNKYWTQADCENFAAKQALVKLRTRLNKPDLSYYME